MKWGCSTMSGATNEQRPVEAEAGGGARADSFVFKRPTRDEERSSV